MGQLIDYAANEVVYWPVEALRGAFESRLERWQPARAAKLRRGHGTRCRRIGKLEVTVMLVSGIEHGRPITTTKTFGIKPPARKHRR